LPDAAKKKPSRRWPLRILGAVAIAMLLAAFAAAFAAHHLDWIARWSIHRLFPGVTAEMGSLRAISPTQLEVRRLVLRSSTTHEVLLSLENGVVLFRFGDVWRLRLEEIRLQHPYLAVSPNLGKALGVQPAASSTPSRPGSSNSLAWAIDRLVVADGRLHIGRFADNAPTVEMAFSANFENFGVGGAAARIEHLVRLSDIRATDRNQNPFLAVGDVDIRFTTEELFGQDHIRSVRIGEGTLSLSPDLIALLSGGQPATSSAAPASPAASQPGWSVGSLNLDGIGVSIPNAPGALGKIQFHVTAALHELGTGTSTDAAKALQRVQISHLWVATDSAPATPVFTADGLDARFTLAGIASHRLEELRIENPSADLSPEAFSAPAASVTATSPRPAVTHSGPAPAANTSSPWTIGRFLCRQGSLRLRGPGGNATISTRFALDMKNVATGGESAKFPQSVTLWNTRVFAGADTKSFLSLDLVQVNFTPEGVIQHQHIDSVRMTGGLLTVGEAMQRLLASNSPSPTPTPATTSANSTASSINGGWSLGALDISGVRARIEDNRPGLSQLYFTLNTNMRNVSANGISSELLDEMQTVELTNIVLRSPIRPAAKIVTLRSVFVRFTLADLAKRHLHDITLLRPTIYVSQDLFTYMERASAGGPEAAPAPQAAPATATVATAPGWSVDHLDVKFGRLVLGSGTDTSANVGLPLEFETSADNLALDNLAKLQIQAVLRVPKQSYEFPDYQIAVNNVRGDLRFSYPPEKGEKNLVQKLEMDGVRWRQYKAKDAWVAVTFDGRGINGLFGGNAYKGYLNGGFSFFFQDSSPWIGWVAGTGVDTAGITDVVAPQNFHLTGPLDFEVQLDAFRKDIGRVRGVFHLLQPGKLKIGKLDDMIANIPGEWPELKQSSTRIALETLRDFDYTKAGGDFWFVDSQGLLNLDLSGPAGSRKFEVALHDDKESPNKWQQGSLGKK
jgi:hypothetical protein